MLFKGFVCEVSGENVSPAECLGCAASGSLEGCNFTYPILNGLVEHNQNRGLSSYSVTQLLGCPLKVRLMREHDYWIAPSKAYWAFRGTLAHAIVEGYIDDGGVAEVRFVANVGEYVLSGQPDLYYPQRKHLVDYKTTKSLPGTRKIYTCSNCGTVMRNTPWKARKAQAFDCSECGTHYTAKEQDSIFSEAPPQPYDNHTQQINLYRLLLAKNGIAIETAEIVYLDMSGVLRLPVELESLDDVEQFAIERLAILNSEDTPDGVYDDDDAKWECGYCDVVSVCEGMRE